VLTSHFDLEIRAAGKFFARPDWGRFLPSVSQFIVAVYVRFCQQTLFAPPALTPLMSMCKVHGLLSALCEHHVTSPPKKFSFFHQPQSIPCYPQ